MISRRAIVDRALRHLGHQEEAPNRSRLIDEWNHRCGVPNGSPWCASFASWCIGTVACAGALRLGAMFPETHYPRTGDLMFFATDDQGHGHCGIVFAADEDELICIEGNSENGIRFTRRKRGQVKVASTSDENVWDYPPLVEVAKVGTR